MSGKKKYEYLVPPKKSVVDIYGKVIGSGKIAILRYKEYNELTKTEGAEDGNSVSK